MLPTVNNDIGPPDVVVTVPLDPSVVSVAATVIVRAASFESVFPAGFTTLILYLIPLSEA
jgi:hypothetical protein